MSTRSLMKKLYPGLTALERALLILGAWKQGAEPDPQVRQTLPAYQAREYNYYIDLMSGVNQNLGPFILLVKALSEQASIRFGWLCTVRVWSADMACVAHAAFGAAREPISESSYQKRLEDARGESVPIVEFAELLAERDLDGDVTDREWKRAVADKATMIQEAIDSGAVAAHRRGRRVLVNAGSFYDWLGEPVPVYPEWGLAYDVRPDGEDLTAAKDRFENLRQALHESSAGLNLPPKFRAAILEEKVRFGDEVAGMLEEVIKNGVARYAKRLSAIETVVAETGEEFGGEDPLPPQLRTALDDLRSMLDDLRRSMEGIGIEVEPTEPDQELVDQVRMLVRRDLHELTLTIRS